MLNYYNVSLCVTGSYHTCHTNSGLPSLELVSKCGYYLDIVMDLSATCTTGTCLFTVMISHTYCFTCS